MITPDELETAIRLASEASPGWAYASVERLAVSDPERVKRWASAIQEMKFALEVLANETAAIIQWPSGDIKTGKTSVAITLTQLLAKHFKDGDK